MESLDSFYFYKLHNIVFAGMEKISSLSNQIERSVESALESEFAGICVDMIVVKSI